MPKSMVIFVSDGFYEPGCKFYFPEGTSLNSTLAGNIGDVTKPLIGADWSVTRWESLAADGSQVSGGNIGGAGEAGGDSVNPKYCAFVRLDSPGPGRPSSKYLHGYTESCSGPRGVATAAYLSALDDWFGVLSAAGLLDSDGVAVTGYTFRAFSRRRHVRRLSE